MWVIDLLVIFPNPYLEILAHPSTFEMLQARERTPIPHSSTVSNLDSPLNLLRSFGVHHITTSAFASTRQINDS